ncbi:MAG: hypothetical protein FWC64_09365 [Treponema sp.]|nr:hypothetical protein [Treponema sp.]
MVKKVLQKSILLIGLLVMSGCYARDILHVSIRNFTDSVFYLTIVVDDYVAIENHRINALSLVDHVNVTPIVGSHRPIYFIFQFRKEGETKSFLEDTLYFPNGGIRTFSAGGGFLTTIDFHIEDGEIKVVYNEHWI